MCDELRYRQLMENDLDPPLFQCRECNLVVADTHAHDRWHRIQDRRVIG